MDELEPKPRPTPPPLEVEEVFDIARGAVRWRRGDRAWAPWEAPFHFPCTVIEASKDQIRVLFDHGAEATFSAHSVEPMRLHVGDRVASRSRFAQGYLLGTIRELGEEGLLVQFDQGGDEWVRDSDLIIPSGEPPPTGQPSRSWLVWLIFPILYIIYRTFVP